MHPIGVESDESDAAKKGKTYYFQCLQHRHEYRNRKKKIISLLSSDMSKVL